MDVTQETRQLKTDLAVLHTGSLRALAAFSGLVGYAWLMLVVWPITGSTATPVAWIGSSLLFLGALWSYSLARTHQDAGGIVLVTATLLAVACAILASHRPQLAYLLVVPVIHASVLLSQRAVFLAAGAACSILLITCSAFLHLPPLSLATALPFSVITITAVASWLSVRNLYTALEWIWHGYKEAHRNEQAAREQQAELRRALKALDEATYRLERTNYMLSVARDQAEEARRLKQQFAQTISHELRTPLNLILSFSDLMAQAPEYYGGPLPAAYARDLGIVHRNARHLQSLVSDVLDLARMEAAQMGLLPEEVEPADLVEEAINAARSLVEARGLALRSDIEPNLPLIWVDPGRIRQVLYNLLNNAARFTEQGVVAVTVWREGDHIHFAIADTGAGIPQDKLHRIFDEFEQIDGGTRRRHSGTGLGLAISKRFVELHGGRIWADSEPGQGSTFYFCLPIDERGIPEQAASSVRGPRLITSANRGKEAILLAVTRSPTAAVLLSRYVRGCRTIVAHDLERARRTAQQVLPQAVIIDTSCVPLDAGALQGLAKTWGLRRTPFLACPLPGEEPSRHQLDVHGYLVKPVSRQSLMDVLRQLGEEMDRVLVIDDDRDFVRLMGRLLDSPVRRHQTIGAYGGHEGLELLQRHQPDLVLLDLVLPDISGLEVISRIRANAAWRDLPIVVVSAQGEFDSVPVMPGSMLATRSTGILPSDVVQWVQHAIGESSRPLDTES